ncbi:cilia- and flagella-associated protein 100-like isoform X2 [Euwallacea fornicatus]|uniref:cilia- and flagella-associated protein 100-like isoform X2 n=1 Tax=Euwallacea fornicatus TaxID=995702 RepID=UPI0033901021
MNRKKGESMIQVLTNNQDSEASPPDQLKFSKSKMHTIKKISIPTKEKLKAKTVKQRYFTTGHRIVDHNKNDFEKDPSPFHYPKDLEEFTYKKLSYKDLQTKGLLKRLYVEEPTINSMKSVLDIAPEYFKVVEGRPIPDRLDIRKYIDILRDSLRTKIVNGYREDDIMLIEDNLLLEQKIIDSIREDYNKYVNAFDEFLSRDHTSSMLLLKESETATRDAYDKYEEYKNIIKKYGVIRSSLYSSEEKWKNCQIYERFLFLVSPFSWRNQRQVTAVSGNIENGKDVEENIFEKYKKMDEKETSLNDLINQFNEEYREDNPPQLYFTDPKQLLDVFKFMEMQNLNSLLHSEELALPLQQVRERMWQARQMFDQEIENLQEILDKLESDIKWEEERTKCLKELVFNLIENEFKGLIIDDEVLNLHVFLEEVYETCIGPNDANLSMSDMMKAIESRYRQELLALDKVPADQVALLESGCYAEQMMVMGLAEKAAKQYAELEQLTHKLNRAFAPAYQKTQGKELKKRYLPLQQMHEAPAPPRQLTLEEAEYLEFFTNFCVFSDDPRDYIDPKMGEKPTKNTIVDDVKK